MQLSVFDASNCGPYAQPTLFVEPQIAAINTLVCAASILLSTSQFKLASLLTVTSLVAVTLCQYCQAGCGHAGSTQYFLERLVGVN